MVISFLSLLLVAISTLDVVGFGVMLISKLPVKITKRISVNLAAALFETAFIL
jgi:hypothetical protein